MLKPNDHCGKQGKKTLNHGRQTSGYCCTFIIGIHVETQWNINIDIG